MNKIFFPLLASLSLILILLIGSTPPNNEYLRIHIRANSNLLIDQNVKYKVKDAVVEALTPLLADCNNKNESAVTIRNNFELIEYIANQTLAQNGFSYTAKASIKNENFPTRTYGNLTLESGFYDALILELGSGSGDNWWCVVYPPLCFVNGNNEVNSYKSRLIEIISDFFEKFKN